LLPAFYDFSINRPLEFVGAYQEISGETTMSRPGVAQIRKRDGSVVPFNPGKIEAAIYKGLTATSSGRKCAG